MVQDRPKKPLIVVIADYLLEVTESFVSITLILQFPNIYIDLMKDRSKKNLPGLYATENIPFEKKIVHHRYQIKNIGFYWLIAELDKKQNLGFGYANLNNDDFAEWGYISIDELLENGAKLDDTWKPCTYREAMKRIAEENKQIF